MMIKVSKSSPTKMLKYSRKESVIGLASSSMTESGKVGRHQEQVLEVATEVAASNAVVLDRKRTSAPARASCSSRWSAT